MSRAAALPRRRSRGSRRVRATLSWQDSRGLWAAVEIKQWTIPKDDKVEYSEYRHRSGLLPEYELCEFQLYCRVEKGQWKAHVINGNVFEAQWPEEQKPSR